MRKPQCVGWIEKPCFVCGKIFINRPEWVYKHTKHDRVISFCSYRCMRAYEEAHKKPTKIEVREEIVKLLYEGVPTKEIANRTGAEFNRVLYWKKKIEREEKEKNEPETEPESSIEVYCGP